MKAKMLMAVFFCGILAFTACKNNNEAKNNEEIEAQRQTELEMQQQKLESEANNIDTKLSTIDSLRKLHGLIETAQMDELLRVGKGPFTFFAPTNSAISEMNKATLDTLMLPEHREDLANLLQYHLIEEDLSYEELKNEIRDNDGEFELSSMDELGVITATLDGDKIVLIDEKGNKATIVKPDIKASNGVIHLIDGVLQFKGEEETAL
ncbi:fasciclin [Christiangramia fulva]|uniref:Fasciclin n=1 Tax=Christiangramia fulva TaxID=2126553 RepID=A0A2R3Z1A7_9FLAO|nr:fasciclin domain-containing protein [Christiangramia fulva]AVR44039.1 fasciclin [Christiangramia fulva]